MIERELLIEKLRNGNVTVKFTKVDGTERTMVCTLQQDVIVPYEKKTDVVKERTNDDAVSVWDVEKDAWRSFKISALTMIEC